MRAPRRALAAACLACGAAGALSPAAHAAPAGFVRLSDERSATRWSYVERRVSVHRAPDRQAARVATLGTRTYLGQAETVLVLGRTKAWALVRYPGIGARTGWVPRGALSRPQRVTLRLEVDRRRLRVTLFDRDRPVFTARAGVGAGGSPTPAGRAYVRERVVPASARGIYGVVAFGLSAFSRHRTDWPGGGQVGVHGTNQPELIPGRISNGCVRLRNADARRLDRHLRIGTPVVVR